MSAGVDPTLQASAENEKLVRTMAAVRDMILSAPESLRQHTIEHGGAILEAGGHDIRPVYENGDVQFDAWDADRIQEPRLRAVAVGWPIVRLSLRGQIGTAGSF